MKPFRNELMIKLRAKKEVRYIRYFTILLHLFILRWWNCQDPLPYS